MKTPGQRWLELLESLQRSLVELVQLEEDQERQTCEWAVQKTPFVVQVVQSSRRAARLKVPQQIEASLGTSAARCLLIDALGATVGEVEARWEG